jgi:predicted Zn finger-like uncharacterized protein
MPLTLNCPKCHKPFRVRDESVGGRVRCPSCGAVLQVPAALSSASHIGLDLPKIDSPPGEMTGAHRPLAEDAPRGTTRAGSMNDLMLGGPGRLDEPVGEHTAGTALPSPPSIKTRAADAPPPPRPLPVAPPTNASIPMMPAPSRMPPPAAAPPKARRAFSTLPPDLAAAWGKARGGLGMIRWGLFFCALPLILAIGHGAWITFHPDSALKQGAGMLGRPELPRYKEVALAYTLIPFTLAALLLFFGRVRCGGAPAESHAKGLARGAAFFTFLAILSIVACVGQTYFDLGTKAQIPPNVLPFVAPVALYLILPSIVLADLLTLLYVGQIGFPVGRPSLQKGVASFFLTIVLAPAAVLIANIFYPIYPTLQAKVAEYSDQGLVQALPAMFTGEDDAHTTRSLIWSVSLFVLVMLIVLRYAGVVGSAKRAVRKYTEGDV